MLYLKPLVRRTTQDEEIISKIERSSSDKESMGYLLSKGYERDKIMEQMEKHYGFKYEDITKVPFRVDRLREFDIKQIKKLRILPYKLDEINNIYHIATNDIMDQKHKADVQSYFKAKGYRVTFIFSFDFELEEMLEKLEAMIVEVTVKNDAEEFDAQDWVEKVIIQGIEKKASDIHIESLEYGVQVRFRVDGLLVDKKFYNYDKAVSSTIMVRIKIISGMDISDKRRPQDGRLDNFKIGNHLYDLRVSSVNTIFGEKIVMRIFDKSSKTLTFEQLGFSKEDTSKIKSMLQSKNGIIYMAGATGSGKTTSLYTMIDFVNRDDINIYTIEDPVEKSIENVNQIQIDALAGIEYASTLRALLRQDPDVIVVGEIRDVETADLSVRASLTGHLVLSTLHANSAIDSINRLMDMGIEPYLLGASSLGFISQRLVRTLCPHCKRRVTNLTQIENDWLRLQNKENQMDANLDLSNAYEAVGCNLCSNGYKGRIAIVEIVEVTDIIREMIKSGVSGIEIKKQAEKEGYKPLALNAIKVVEQGLTSVSEIMKQI